MAEGLIESPKMAALLKELEAVGITDTASLSSSANRALELAQQCQLPGLLSETQQTYGQLHRLRIMLDEKWNHFMLAEDTAALDRVAAVVTSSREATEEWAGMLLDTAMSACECSVKGKG